MDCKKCQGSGVVNNPSFNLLKPWVTCSDCKGWGREPGKKKS